MVSPSQTRTSKKFCLFHKNKRHDIEDCFILKKEIEKLIGNGYLKIFIKGHAHIEYDREELNQPA
jgi:hypothetical protein